MAKIPKIQIIEKKLGRERIYGQAHDDGLVEIDSRLSPRKHLEIAIHEILHILHPEASETKVLLNARKMRNELWKMGYRRLKI